MTILKCQIIMNKRNPKEKQQQQQKINNQTLGEDICNSITNSYYPWYIMRSYKSLRRNNLV